jgi:queuine tRNA-ribosyltransferase
MNAFSFQITHNSSKSNARLGILNTPHGEVQTPAFIFCATKAAIKGVTTTQLHEANTQFILSNTYHLMLQPGADTVEKLGGLHKMMNWNKPMLTDSGGYQIFSFGYGSVAEEIKGNRKSAGFKKGSTVKITEEGAVFRSYFDGSKQLLTPERSIQVQKQLGADIILVLDECTPFHVSQQYTRKSMDLSHRWAIRSLAEFNRTNNGMQKLYGIIQGGVYQHLRKESCDFVNSNDFFGNAVGGSLGQTKNQMHDVVGIAMQTLNRNRPTHLLGIGGVADIFNGVREGVDTFDCVHPTRLARHGGALVKKIHANDPEYINLKKMIYKNSTSPISPTCGCSTCLNYSTGYINHLIKAGEMLAHTLISIHNIYFMNQLLTDIRTAIKLDTLDDCQNHYLADK